MGERRAVNDEGGVGPGLLDPRLTRANLAALIPPRLPSELDPLEFQLGD